MLLSISNLVTMSGPQVGRQTWGYNVKLAKEGMGRGRRMGREREGEGERGTSNCYVLLMTVSSPAAFCLLRHL